MSFLIMSSAISISFPEAVQDYAIAVRRRDRAAGRHRCDHRQGAKADGELKALFDKAAKAYEIAHGYKSGSRNLGARPWECASQSAGTP